MATLATPGKTRLAGARWGGMGRGAADWAVVWCAAFRQDLVNPRPTAPLGRVSGRVEIRLTISMRELPSP